MNLPSDLLTYRVLLRGEGLGEDGRWLGFFTTRQTRAASEAAAVSEAVSGVLESWPEESEGFLSAVQTVLPVETKQVRIAWLKRPRGGFTFFNEDQDAEFTAQRIERRAAGF